MKNNNKGITLVALAITLIVMLILSGTTIAVSSIVQNAQRQGTITNMLLIQTKVKILKERAAFSGDTQTYYIGTKLKNQPNKAAIAKDSLTSAELEKETLYVYNNDTLTQIGLEGIKLNENEIIIVDYEDADIIYPNGVNNNDGTTVYKLSEMLWFLNIKEAKWRIL